MVTALVLVLMLGLGALFVSVSTEYAEETYSLLFGEVFGVGSRTRCCRSRRSARSASR